MFILGTICCRKGSKGIPGKNLILLNERPLFDYTAETALKCHSINKTIVSTDSEIIAKQAGERQLTVPFIRPHALASDTASKWDVFKHALLFFEKSNGLMVDYLVDMDVTVPLKIPEDVEGAIAMAVSHPETDVVITAFEPERNPYFNMMETDESGRATIVKQPENVITCRQQAPPVFSLSPAAYVIKREALFKFSHWSKAACRLYILPRERAVDIDTIDDLNYINYLMKTNESKAF